MKRPPKAEKNQLLLCFAFSNVASDMRKGRDYKENTAVFQDGLLSHVKS